MTMFNVAFNMGTFIGYIVGHFLSFRLGPLVAIGFGIVFMILFSAFPETPRYLILKNKINEAEKSLKIYRNLKSDTQTDMLTKITNEINRMESFELNQGKFQWSCLRNF